MRKKLSVPLLFFFLLLTFFYYFTIQDNQKKCYGVELNVLTINSFNLNPDIPRISYIGSSFADMTITRLSSIKGINLIERTHLERAKKKLGIKPDAFITKEMAVKIGDLLNADLVVIGTIQALTRDSFRAGSQILDLRKGDNKEEEVFISETVNIEGGIEGIEKSANIEAVNKLQGEIAQYITDAVPVALTEEQVKEVNKDYTRSGPAYVCYAQGRDFYVKYTEADNDKAIEFFKKAIDIDPNYALACAGLSDAYAQKGGFYRAKDKDYNEEAILKARKAIELDPNLPEGYKALGTAYGYKGWFNGDTESIDKSIENFNKALEYNDYYIDAHLDLGKMYFRKKNFVMAEEEFEKALKIDPYSSKNHYYMAYFYTRYKNDDEALYNKSLNEYEMVIKLEPESKLALDSYINIACYYIDKDRLDKAKEELMEAEKINPDYSYCHYARALLYSKEEKYEEALKEMEDYLNMEKESINEPIYKEKKEIIEKIIENIKEKLENEKK